MEVLRAVILVLLGWLSLGVTSLQCGDRGSVEVHGGRRGSDGWLEAEDGTRYPPGCFWFTSPNNISGCPGKVKPCVAKCCLEDQARDENYKCSPSNNSLLDSLLPKPTGNFDTTHFDRVNVNPCYLGAFIPEAKHDKFVLLKNASLFLRHLEEDVEQIYETGDFCQEVVEQNDSAQIRYFVCVKQDNIDETNKKLELKFLIYSIAAMVSVPFLIATLVVYAVLPELRNRHGKCLMSHVSSLIVAFVCLAWLQLGINLLSTGGCITAALIFYFSFLASFFWLNVMCFDIWWTFSGYRGRLGPKDPRDRLKFVYYSCYAWGAALVLLCVCAAMQFSENIPDNYLRPEFGEQLSCWFHDEATKWAYFDGPIAVILVVNIVFFTLTALSIWKIKKQTAVLTESKDSQRNAHTQKSELQFKLYLKLFVVMGVPWTLEIISTIVGGPDYLWWVTDLANLLVGIPIFIIFVWKSKVKQLFLAKLNIKMGSSVETSGYELT